MDNEKLAKQLESCKNNDETLKVLADNGINISAEEMNELVKSLRAQESGDELSEDALEGVAGGLKMAYMPVIVPLLRHLVWRT